MCPEVVCLEGMYQVEGPCQLGRGVSRSGVSGRDVSGRRAMLPGKGCVG